MNVDPEHCLTCSDEAVVATVVEVKGANATVEVNGERTLVGIELVDPIEPGDVLLCHAGIALEKVP